MQMLQGGFLSLSLSHHDSSAAAADELGCRDSVCSQGGPQETQTWRAGLPERRLPHYCWHQHGTVMCKRSVCCQSLFSSILTQAPDRSFSRRRDTTRPDTTPQERRDSLTPLNCVRERLSEWTPASASCRMSALLPNLTPSRSCVVSCQYTCLPSVWLSHESSF